MLPYPFFYFLKHCKQIALAICISPLREDLFKFYAHLSRAYDFLLEVVGVLYILGTSLLSMLWLGISAHISVLVWAAQKAPVPESPCSFRQYILTGLCEGRDLGGGGRPGSRRELLSFVFSFSLLRNIFLFPKDPCPWPSQKTSVCLLARTELFGYFYLQERLEKCL